MDGNPIFHLKGYFEFCLMTCPNLKHLDLRKITPEMRDAGGALKPGELGKGPKVDDSTHKNENATLSTDISPDKAIAANMMQ